MIGQTLALIGRPTDRKRLILGAAREPHLPDEEKSIPLVYVLALRIAESAIAILLCVHIAKEGVGEFRIVAEICAPDCSYGECGSNGRAMWSNGRELPGERDEFVEQQQQQQGVSEARNAGRSVAATERRQQQCCSRPEVDAQPIGCFSCWSCLG